MTYKTQIHDKLGPNWDPIILKKLIKEEIFAGYLHIFNFCMYYTFTKYIFSPKNWETDSVIVYTPKTTLMLPCVHAKSKKSSFIFCGVRDLNLKLCIYYLLSLLIELSLRWQILANLVHYLSRIVGDLSYGCWIEEKTLHN